MKKKEKKYYLKKLLNKYIIIGCLFIIWMFFFDTNSYLNHRALDKEIKRLHEVVYYYKNKIEKETKEYNSLKNNPEEREKYVRENYFFKKKNEEVFIVIIDSLNADK